MSRGWRDMAMIDQLKTIGIEKGKPFNPDDRQTIGSFAVATTKLNRNRAIGAFLRRDIVN